VTFGSLFAGIGGFDLGFEQAGMKCKWQCEIDKHANKILEKHWPNVRRYKDVRELKNPEYVDVICGGFPCQDLSLAGNRKGLAGERSGLFFEAVRIIREVKPRWIVIENVPGLFSSNNGQDMRTVLQELVECGYSVAWRVLDSQYFGVPQRRRRIFIVGHTTRQGGFEVLFEANQELSQKVEKRMVQSHTLVAANGQINNRGSTWGGGIVISTLKAEGVNTMSRVEYVEQNGIRTLTPIECERLQGFPDDWTKGISDRQRFKTLGNAVTVNVIKWIGKRIIERNET